MGQGTRCVCRFLIICNEFWRFPTSATFFNIHTDRSTVFLVVNLCTPILTTKQNHQEQSWFDQLHNRGGTVSSQWRSPQNWHAFPGYYQLYCLQNGQIRHQGIIRSWTLASVSRCSYCWCIYVLTMASGSSWVFPRVSSHVPPPLYFINNMKQRRTTWYS